MNTSFYYAPALLVYQYTAFFFGVFLLFSILYYYLKQQIQDNSKAAVLFKEIDLQLQDYLTSVSETLQVHYADSVRCVTTFSPQDSGNEQTFIKTTQLLISDIKNVESNNNMASLFRSLSILYTSNRDLAFSTENFSRETLFNIRKLRRDFFDNPPLLKGELFRRFSDNTGLSKESLSKNISFFQENIDRLVFTLEIENYIMSEELISEYNNLINLLENYLYFFELFEISTENDFVNDLLFYSSCIYFLETNLSAYSEDSISRLSYGI